MAAGVGIVPPRTHLRRTSRPVRGVGRGWVVAAGALWAVLLLDVLRVWLPSVVHLAGAAPPARSPVQLSLIALACLLAPLPAVACLRRIPPARVWTVSLTGLAAARVALQFVDGGTLQLGLSMVGIALAVLSLAALAAGVPSGHLARLGVFTGLSVSVAAHAALGTLDLVWRPGPAAAAVVLATATAAVVAAVRASQVPLWWPTSNGGTGAAAPVWTRGPAWPWLIVGPTVALAGLLVGVPARLDLAVGLGPRPAAVATVLAAGTAIATAVATRRSAGPWAGAAAAAAVLLTTVVALRPVGVGAAAAQLGLLVALGAAVGALGRTPGDSGPRRRASVAVASALLLWGLLVAYFASYEVRVTIPSRAWLVVAAGAIALLSGASAWTGRAMRPDRRPLGRHLGAIAAVTLVVAVGLGATAPPSPSSPDGTPPQTTALRLATYNVGSGFGTDGRFDPDAIAAVLREADVDVVVLNEVDRGWLLEGGHDLVHLLAERAELPHTAFAPAADDVWGNAVLSRLPLTDIRTERLPRGQTAMARSWVSATVDLGPGRTLNLLGTQFHGDPAAPQVRLAQARAVAAEVARLGGQGVPVVVLGDLGADPEAPELTPLDFLVDVGPSRGATRPADAPRERPDHILTTPDVRTTGEEVVTTTATRQRPIVVSVHLEG